MKRGPKPKYPPLHELQVGGRVVIQNPRPNLGSYLRDYYGKRRGIRLKTCTVTTGLRVMRVA